jgi:hypothetical protein
MSLSPKSTVVRVRGDGLNLVAKLGDGPVLISDGYGGWESVSRPQNKPMTRWTGQPALRLQVPLIFDRSLRKTVGRDVARIMSLGRRRGGTERPPTFRMIGYPLPHSGMRFVLESMPEIGTVIRDRNGATVRQTMTVTLLEYVDEDQVRFKRSKPRARVVKARKGDTVNKIAQRVFEGEGRKVILRKARAIAKINDIRDRNKELTPGRKVRVPLS